MAHHSGRNAVRVLCDEDDFALLAAETIRALARQNVRHAEVNFSLCDHLERGIPAEVVFAGLERGRAQGGAEHDITIRWVPDFPGHFGVASGEATLDAVLTHGPGPASVLGFSIGGLEVDRAPSPISSAAPAPRDCAACRTPGKPKVLSACGRRSEPSVPIASATASAA